MTSYCLLSSPSSQMHIIEFTFQPNYLKIGNKTVNEIRISIFANPLSFVPLGLGKMYPNSFFVKKFIDFKDLKPLCEETLDGILSTGNKVIFMTETSHERENLLMRIHIVACCQFSKKIQTLSILKEFKLPNFDDKKSTFINLESQGTDDFSVIFFESADNSYTLDSQCIETEETSISCSTKDKEKKSEYVFNLNRYFHSMKDGNLIS